MYSLPCIMLGNFASKSATNTILIVLRGNRAEGEQRSRGGVTPSGLHCCQAEVNHKLAGELAQPVPTS